MFDTSHAMMQHPTDVGHVYEVWRSIWGEKTKQKTTQTSHSVYICMYRY